jgi:hypothetical protein
MAKKTATQKGVDENGEKVSTEEVNEEVVSTEEDDHQPVSDRDQMMEIMAKKQRNKNAGRPLEHGLTDEESDEEEEEETPPNSEEEEEHYTHNFSSFHPAGTNFLLGDGSVRLISETIDTQVYFALCTRAGGEPVGEY